MQSMAINSNEVKDSPVLQLAEAAKIASAELAVLSSEDRNNVLLRMADLLEENAEKIIAENNRDMEAAKILVEAGNLNQSLYGRLKFDRSKLDSVLKGIRQVASLPDPIGKCDLARELDNGLNLYRITCPLGVIAVIFESRPDAFPQIVSLSLKAGNAIILKGGKEAEHSNRILFQVLRKAVVDSGLPPACITLIETREDVSALLAADAFVDLVIPRGSNDLVRHVQNNTRIPVLGHADGICHIFLDEDADADKATRVVVDAKVQYPSACNAVETILIHKKSLPVLLPKIVAALQKENVELRLDEYSLHEINNASCHRGAGGVIDLAKLKPASHADWCTEYCDLILSIAAVDSIDDAITHINKFGSGHTDSIVTENKEHFDLFFHKVKSAGVYWNASTRFADGFRYGFGAEVGISTASMHPRGPVGLEGLVSYKYKLDGDGHIVADYSGPDAKQFTHRDL